MDLFNIMGNPKYEIKTSQSIFYNCKVINVYRACAVIESVLDTALAPLGLSTAQWGTLRIIQESPGASGADISRLAFVISQAAATMRQRLEQAGLITRCSSNRGRVLKTYLTSYGEEILRSGERIAQEVEARFFSNFEAEEKHQFNPLLSLSW
jgi:DNA-binding MarR family transcriptional regulator